VTQPWAFSGGPVDHVVSGVVTLIEGSTFCISCPGGDIQPGGAQGLFVRDTRMLSRWVLTLDGLSAQPLTMQPAEPYSATFVTRVPPSPEHADSTMLVVRRRYVGNGMREDVTVLNVAAHDATCTVALAAATDLADLFEVKEGWVHAPDATSSLVDDAQLRIVRRGQEGPGLLVRADGSPAILPDSLRWDVAIPARGEWSTSVEVVPTIDGAPMTPRHPRGHPVEHAAPARLLRQWRRRSPDVRTADRTLARVLRRSIEDIGALRIFDPEHTERAVVAAGAPWFMALFGRDSLLTSWMVLPVDAGLALGTLQTLADHQGRAVNHASEEEPGRILHEMRFGATARLALGGRSVYYGTADATPLFVMLLGELRRWGHHHEEVEALLPNADRALDWIERYGDADGDGFLEYVRKSDRGLVNQGWKDSWEGVTFANGQVAQPPIALAEVQGYVYAAYRARAQLAAEYGDASTARRWAGKAEQLKAAFNATFWLPDRGWFAAGLDRSKRPIDALASNIGHCLWTGIVDEDKAGAIADHLLSAEMFSGWGIRTLATSMAAYNPMSYHNGSVWPHDNALCMAGLMRYGFVEHAQRVAEALLDAATHFGHRPPELFCGFARDAFPAPVPYPTSCSPQAWASAAPLLLLRSMLRFDPHVPAKRLWCSPAVPRRYLPLRIHGMGLGESQLTIEVRDSGWKLAGNDSTGAELTRGPRPPVAGRNRGDPKF